MKKCRTTTGAFTALLLATSTLAIAADLASLKSEYAQLQQKANATYDAATQNSLLLYSNTLATAETQLKKEGNLESLLAVRKEKERFGISGDIQKPALADLPQIVQQAQAAHFSRIEQAEKTRDKNLAIIAKQYLTQLETLKKQLTSQDKIDDALQVQAEMKAVESALSLVPAPVASPANADNVKPNQLSGLPSKGLVLHFTFADAKKTEVSDRSGKRNNGKPYEMEPYKDPSRGAVFKADNLAYIEVAHSATLTPKSFTVLAWVNPSVTNGAIVDKHDWDNGNSPKGYVLRFGKGMKANFTVGNGNWFGVSSTGEIPRNQWTHLAGSFDGSTVRMYVNGNEEASARVPSPVVPSKYPLRIGAGTFDKSAARKYEGLVDQVMVFDRALSSEEIEQIHKATKSEKTER